MACSFCATAKPASPRQLSVGRDRRTKVARARQEALPAAFPTWSSWAWANPWPTTTGCGRPSSSSTPTSAFPPATITVSTVGSSRVSGGWRRSPARQPGRLAARGARRAPQPHRPHQPPLPPVGTDGCLRGVPDGQKPALSFEWALIAGVNDTAPGRRRTGRARLAVAGARSTSIPLNPTRVTPAGARPRPGRLVWSRAGGPGVKATVRPNAGPPTSTPPAGKLAAGQVPAAARPRRAPAAAALSEWHTELMANTRWIDQSQPQTLYMPPSCST